MCFSILFKEAIIMGIATNSTDNFQKCIDECNRCAQACHECFTACLNESDVAARKTV